MLTKHEPLVSGIDDDGVVHLAGLFKVLEKASKIIIDTSDTAEELFKIGVVSKAGIFLCGVISRVEIFGEFCGEAGRKIDKVVAPWITRTVRSANVRNEFIAMSSGGDRAPFWVALPEGFRLGDLNVFQKSFIAWCVFKVIVRSFVVVHQEERLLLIPSFF